MQIENNKEANVPKNTERLENRIISQLKEQKVEQFLSSINVYLNCISYGVISLDSKGEISGVNRQFIEMWDIVDTKRILNNVQQCKLYLEGKVKKSEKIDRLIWNKIAESEDGNLEILELKNGKIFAIGSFCQELEKEIVGRVCLFWDVSELATMSDEKISKLNQLFLQKEDKLTNFLLTNKPITVANGNSIKAIQYPGNTKSFFLSKLCHQFRSLLNVISFSNSLLKRGLSLQNKKEQQKNLWLIGNIQTGVEDIIQLLDELVFYGQIENGIIKCEPNKLNLNVFCEEIIAGIAKSSLEKQQTIELNNCCTSSKICLDRQLLQQMLVKLLANAIKFSPENSSIDLNISCKKQAITFQIRDRGIGIKQEDIASIFEPFFRGGNASQTKGNGIGLAIVKTIVAMQGGEVDVSSQINVGTTVTVTLPLSDSDNNDVYIMS